MTPALLLGVGLLGGLGAVARFALDGAVSRRTDSLFPVGILVVNLSGTAALGVLVGASVSGHALLLAGTGLLGAFTTFSTWMLQSHALAESGERRLALINVTGSLAAGLVAVWLAHAIGTLL